MKIKPFDANACVALLYVNDYRHHYYLVVIIIIIIIVIIIIIFIYVMIQSFWKSISYLLTTLLKEKNFLILI